MVVEIEGTEIKFPENLYDKVTYVPTHANGNAGHEDCEQGVIVGIMEGSAKLSPTIRVLYCKGRSVQHTSPSDLIWG